MVEIIQRTPVWVWVLFFLLLVLGYVQSKERTLGYTKALLMPYAMFLFSLYGVLASFGWAYTLLLWVVGIAGGIFLGMRLSAVHEVVYVPANQTFIIKGSWFWCALIMLLFCVKYSVGVMLARQLEVVQTLFFSASVSVVYGLFSGIFFARVIVLRHLHVKHKTVEVKV